MIKIFFVHLSTFNMCAQILTVKIEIVQYSLCALNVSLISDTITWMYEICYTIFFVFCV